MKIPIQSLSKPVIITGHTFWGRPAEVEFFPSNKLGITWHTEGEDVPIDLRLASVRKRRIELRRNGDCLSIVEHLFALRWAGLSCSIKGQRLPYFATATEVWSRFLPHLSPENISSSRLWVRPDKSHRFNYPNKDRWVAYLPLAEDKLILDVTIDFPGLGKWTEEYTFPDDVLLARVLRARPLAWPPRLRVPASFMAHRFGWPHYQKFMWPHDIRNGNLEASLREICDHRALDILGALALVHKFALPAIRYKSYRGGHWGDINALSLATWS